MAVNVENIAAQASGKGIAATVAADETTVSTKLPALPAMTPWYDPRQLLETAKKTLISTIIGENADPRLVTAAATGGKFFDYSQVFKIGKDGDFESDGAPRDEIWIDYVSDVGDGWNSTYSVAYALAQENLNLRGEATERGEILVFGGDGVYPTATTKEYESKLVVPYRSAFNASRRQSAPDGDKKNLKKHPHVFVLPGNHDWYDSLVSFQKIFCTHILNDRIFAGGWRTRQKRSYFALKLPHKWWLLGVDLQLSHNIDTRQLTYFESVVAKMSAGDRAILCVPEPYWVKAIKYKGMTDVFEEKEASIEKLENMLAAQGVETRLYVAGDLHHYRRFTSTDGRRIQKITAGGGGAFLHPTHDFDFYEPDDGTPRPKRDFVFEEQYPEAAVSKRLDWGNLYGFIFRNPSFGVLTAIMYPLLAWLIHGEVTGDFHWKRLLTATVSRAVDEPLSTLIVALMVAGLIFFTDSNSKWQKYLGGAIHAAAHLLAIFALGWLSFYLTLRFLGLADTRAYTDYAVQHPTVVNLVWLGCIWLVCGIGGYIVGSLIMGVYLFLSLHVFGRHDNEAFSALKIEDFKNFLRLHIDSKGDLTIFPIKIERVGRKWKYNKSGEFYEPQEEVKPDLIEEKITI